MTLTSNELRSAHLLRCAGVGQIESNARIAWNADGLITAIDTDGGPTAKGTLLMPPLANAHDHGRGIKTLAYGAGDTAVEAWVPATYTLPPIDPYLVAAAAFARMARSGIGCAVHCHLSRDPDTLRREAQAVARAAHDVGIRIAFVVPLRDRHRLGYGADEAILKLLRPADAEILRARSLRPIAPVQEQIALVDAIAQATESPLFKVQYGPVGVEWCSDALLAQVAQGSQDKGRRVHMHLLESRLQREWADHHYPQGIVRHLDAIGLLSPRLTVAHGTWLRMDECELLAERGVTVSINTSSNLRLRSGIAPLRDICDSGLRFAVGLDALGLDDDDDLLREMRLLRLLHAGQGFDAGVSQAAVLEAACRQGAHAAGHEDGGALEVGASADLLLLDLSPRMNDLCEQLTDMATLLHSRAGAGQVHTLVVAGRVVVAEGRVLGVDLAALEAQLASELSAHAPDLLAHRPVLQRYQAALAGFYGRGGHRA